MFTHTFTHKRIIDGSIFPKDLTLPGIETNSGEFNGEQSIMELGTTSLTSRPQSRGLGNAMRVLFIFYPHIGMR